MIQYPTHALWCTFLRDIGELSPEHAECPESDSCQSTHRYNPFRLVPNAN